ncbi:hypothetical protein C9374_001901 [Naegleria lovaniensis]|uniref:Uncharacterized protein n=1 Tax=Naegleria lovaniensis TaxID=51637 RepID=A0AA88GR35_NAELO|nr:uncharacterized protein C9374_001901 [Naegleria lovaniensis]KAG2386866.1 hypothetical protein C9374_001901 [Naegleria lovaniensis]
MHLLHLSEKYTDNRELYNAIMKEYHNVYTEAMKNFTTNSEYCLLYPKAPNVTKIENTQQTREYNCRYYLSEIRKFYEHFGTLDSFHSIFSINNKSLGNNMYILQASDESPSDTYPMVQCCMSGLCVMINEKKNLTFIGIPILPCFSLTWALSSKKPKRCIVNNTETQLFVKYGKRYHRKLICWNSDMKRWSAISCRDLCLLDIDCYKNLLSECGEHTEMFEQIQCFTLIIDEDEQSTGSPILVGYTCLYKDDTFTQAYVTDWTDLQHYLHVTQHCRQRLPYFTNCYTLQSIPLISPINSHQVMLYLQDTIHTLLEGNLLPDIELIEVMQKNLDTPEAVTIFQIKAPLYHYRLSLSKFILEYSNCVFKNDTQLPKSIIQETCFNYIKWLDGDLEKDLSLMLLNCSHQKLDSSSLSGNTIQTLCAYLRKQFNWMQQLEKELLNLFTLCEEGNNMDCIIKHSVFKIEHHSLIKNIFIHMNKHLSNFHQLPQQREPHSVRMALFNCLRATENSKIQSLLLPFAEH